MLHVPLPAAFGGLDVPVTGLYTNRRLVPADPLTTFEYNHHAAPPNKPVSRGPDKTAQLRQVCPEERDLPDICSLQEVCRQPINRGRFLPPSSSLPTCPSRVSSGPHRPRLARVALARLGTPVRWNARQFSRPRKIPTSASSADCDPEDSYWTMPPAARVPQVRRRT